MKKIITFLFCTAVLSSAFAQRDYCDRNDRNTSAVTYGNSNDNQWNYQRNDNWNNRPGRNYRMDNNNYPGYQNNSYNIYQRDQQIQKINYQYDYQAQQVMNNWSLSRWEKRDAIRDLQTQKAQQINNINYRCSDTNVYNDHSQSNN